MATASETKVIEAYIGLLGRAPDPSGLAYWTAQLDAAGGTTDALKKLTNDITLSAEWDAKSYGTSTTVDGVTTVTFTKAEGDTVVNDMYANLFEKEGAAAPSEADVKYWSDQLQDGTVTASEMAVLLIAGAGTTDAATLAFKTEAATYYVENVSQTDFNRTTAAESVADVQGPQSLATSKAATDAISTGVGATVVLTAANTAAVSMTGGDDTVTGTVGTDATYATTNTLLDSNTNDSDVLNLSGDASFTFGKVTNVETVNVSLAKQAGTTFEVTATELTGGMNLTTATSVQVAGLTVDGSTVAKVENLSGNITTTGVTDLSLGYNTAAPLGTQVTLDGDASLVTVTANDIPDAGLVITLANDSASGDINLGGNDGTNDSVSIIANNAVDVDLDDAAGDIDFLTLSGNTNDVVYTISDSSSALAVTIAGSKNVGIAMDVDDATGVAIVDSSTGTSTVTLSNLDIDADLTKFSNVDVVSVGAITNGKTLTFNDSQDITMTAGQGNAGADVGNYAQGNGNDGTLEITIDAGTATTFAIGAIESDNFADLKINGNTLDLTKVDIDTSGSAAGNDSNITVVTTGDIAATDLDAGDGNITISGNDVVNTGDTTGVGIDVDGIGVVTLEVVTGTGVVDINTTGAVTANDIDGGTGAGNDTNITGSKLTVGITNAVQNDITGDDISITLSNDTAASVINGNITATNDIVITGGNIDVTNPNGATDGDIVAGGDLTIAGTSDVSVADSVSSGGAITITGASKLAVTTGTTAQVGGVTITSSCDVDLGAFTGTVINAGAATGAVTIDNTDNGTGAGIVIVTGSGNDALTLNDAAEHEVNSGGGADAFVITNVGNTSVINAGSGADTIDLNDVNTTATFNGGADNDAFDIVVTTAAVDGGDGTDTLTLAHADHSAAGSFVNFEKVVISTGDNTEISAAQFANENTFELSGAHTLNITAGNTNETVDASALTFDVNNIADLAITGGTGNDTLTGSDVIDVILGGDGTDVISAGDGADTITGGTGNDTLTGGGGIDKFVYAASTAGAATDGVDTYVDFVSGTDTLDINTFTPETGNFNTYVSSAVAATTATVLDHTKSVNQLTGVTLSAADASDGAKVIAAISNGTLTTNATADKHILSLVTTDGTTYLYTVVEGTGTANTAIESGDIVLIGIFDLTVGGFASAADFI
jgi:hypothetical protein